MHDIETNNFKKMIHGARKELDDRDMLIADFKKDGESALLEKGKKSFFE